MTTKRTVSLEELKSRLAAAESEMGCSVQEAYRRVGQHEMSETEAFLDAALWDEAIRAVEEAS